MVERLKFYIETQGMLTSQFADAIGMPRSSFSQLLSGRNKSISDATIAKIHAAFPNLSIMWLLFGEGEMLSTSPSNHQADFLSQSQLSIFGENEIPDNNVEIGAKYVKEVEVGGGDPLLESATDVTNLSEPKAPVYHSLYTPQANKKRITHVVVYYNDNTFETLRPE